MRSIIYISKAVHRFRREELAALLTDARDRNRRTGITGLLLYCDACFLQLIEGPEAAIEALYASISRDTRHRDVRLIASEAVSRREFATWNMAFEQLQTAEWRALSSEIRRVAQLGADSPVEPGVAKAILTDFWHARPTA